MPSVTHSRLWAITSYYNPLNYHRRQRNYRVFKERLPLPLLTVELVYNAPELASADAEILLQLPGHDVMWQKERLLNIAVARLPPECDRVVWIDADVFFEDPGWPSRVDALLDTVPLAQPFARVHHLAENWLPGLPPRAAVEFSRSSVARSVAGGASPVAALEHRADRSRTPATGYVWAARRELIERHGLYDAAIIGGGDRLLAYASFGEPEAAGRVYDMGARRRDHYLAWAEAWQRAVGGAIGTLDCDLMTLWHGAIDDRGIGRRNLGLVANDFDPCRDIALDERGVWRWASDKPALHAWLRDYFASRREDG